MRAPLKVRIVGQSFDITSCAAVVVAVVAVAASIHQGKLMRRHFEMSIRPHLEFNSYFSSTGAYWGIGVSNDGLGPAVVHSVQLCLDGQKLPNTPKNGWHYVEMLNGLDESNIVFKTLLNDDVISPGENKLLFGYRAPPPRESRGRRYIVRDVARRLDYLVCYCSFTEDCEFLAARSGLGSIRRSVQSCETIPAACLEEMFAISPKSLAPHQSNFREQLPILESVP